MFPQDSRNYFKTGKYFVFSTSTSSSSRKINDSYLVASDNEQNKGTRKTRDVSASNYILEFLFTILL